jgi:hypothetical protein
MFAKKLIKPKAATEHKLLLKKCDQIPAMIVTALTTPKAAAELKLYLKNRPLRKVWEISKPSLRSKIKV